MLGLAAHRDDDDDDDDVSIKMEHFPGNFTSSANFNPSHILQIIITTQNSKLKTHNLQLTYTTEKRFQTKISSTILLLLL